MTFFKQKKELKCYELNVFLILKGCENRRYFLRSKTKDKLLEETNRIFNMHRTQEILQLTFEDGAWSIPKEQVAIITTQIIEIFE